MSRLRALVVIAVAAVGCGEPPPSRVTGTLVTSVGGKNGSITGTFASTVTGGVGYSAGANGTLANVVLPVASKGASGAAPDVVGLALEYLPPMLLWAGPAGFPVVRVAALDKTVWSTPAQEDAAAVFTFAAFEVTGDAFSPFIVRGSIVGKVTNGNDSLTFTDTTFILGADCSPTGTTDAHLCGDQALYAQFYGLGTDQTDCPGELVRHFIGTSVNVNVTERVLTIGDVGAPFTCVPTEKEPKDKALPRMICHASVVKFAAGGCTWNADAVTTPQARYFTLAARSVGACAKATCNAIKY